MVSVIWAIIILYEEFIFVGNDNTTSSEDLHQLAIF